MLSAFEKGETSPEGRIFPRKRKGSCSGRFKVYTAVLNVVVRLLVRVSVSSGLVILLFASNEGKAQQTGSPTNQQAGTADADSEDAGQDPANLANPQNLLQLRYTYRTSPGRGSVPGTLRTVTSNIVVLRADFAFSLDPTWKAVFRTDLPFIARDPITPQNPSGGYLYGVGDPGFQVAFTKQPSALLAVSAAIRITPPIGSDDVTSDQWRIAPAVAGRIMLPQLSAGSFFEGILRYDKSLAGDSTKRNISQLQLAPSLSVRLPDRWFLTLYPSPDIRVNYGDPVAGQTGRLFLPFDCSVGRSMTKAFTPSLEIGVPIIKDYPVYQFKMMLRLNMRF